MTVRALAKAVARSIATAAVLPAIWSYHCRAWIFGADRALEGSTQAFALWPGLTGQYMRRAFLRRVLGHCANTATIEFGTIFSQVGATIGEYAYVGPHCHIGRAHIGRDVLVAAGVHIPSGAHGHGMNDPARPMREQEQCREPVHIGAGSWIGCAAVVMADVGSNTVIGAGAVVTTPIPDNVVATGVPARVIRQREPRIGADRAAMSPCAVASSILMLPTPTQPR